MIRPTAEARQGNVWLPLVRGLRSDETSPSATSDPPSDPRPPAVGPTPVSRRGRSPKFQTWVSPPVSRLGAERSPKFQTWVSPRVCRHGAGRSPKFPTWVSQGPAGVLGSQRPTPAPGYRVGASPHAHPFGARTLEGAPSLKAGQVQWAACPCLFGPNQTGQSS